MLHLDSSHIFLLAYGVLAIPSICKLVSNAQTWVLRSHQEINLRFRRPNIFLYFFLSNLYFIFLTSLTIGFLYTFELKFLHTAELVYGSMTVNRCHIICGVFSVSRIRCKVAQTYSCDPFSKHHAGLPSSLKFLNGLIDLPMSKT